MIRTCRCPQRPLHIAPKCRCCFGGREIDLAIKIALLQERMSVILMGPVNNLIPLGKQRSIPNPVLVGDCICGFGA